MPSAADSNGPQPNVAVSNHIPLGSNGTLNAPKLSLRQRLERNHAIAAAKKNCPYPPLIRQLLIIHRPIQLKFRL